MADAIRLSSPSSLIHSLGLSSPSLLTSFSSTSNSLGLLLFEFSFFFLNLEYELRVLNLFQSTAACSIVIDHTTGTCAELWGLHDGLQLAANRRLYNLIVEADSQNIIRHVIEGVPKCHIYSSIILDCRNFLQQLGNVKVKQSFREANNSADLLDEMGRDMESDFACFDSPPECIKLQILYDAIDCTMPRTGLVSKRQ